MSGSSTSFVNGLNQHTNHTNNYQPFNRDVKQLCQETVNEHLKYPLWKLKVIDIANNIYHETIPLIDKLITYDIHGKVRQKFDQLNECYVDVIIDIEDGKVWNERCLQYQVYSSILEIFTSSLNILCYQLYIGKYQEHSIIYQKLSLLSKFIDTSFFLKFNEDIMNLIIAKNNKYDIVILQSILYMYYRILYDCIYILENKSRYRSMMTQDLVNTRKQNEQGIISVVNSSQSIPVVQSVPLVQSVNCVNSSQSIRSAQSAPLVQSTNSVNSINNSENVVSSQEQKNKRQKIESSDKERKLLCSLGYDRYIFPKNQRPKAFKYCSSKTACAYTNCRLKHKTNDKPKLSIESIKLRYLNKQSKWVNFNCYECNHQLIDHRYIQSVRHRVITCLEANIFIIPNYEDISDELLKTNEFQRDTYNLFCRKCGSHVGFAPTSERIFVISYIDTDGQRILYHDK